MIPPQSPEPVQKKEPTRVVPVVVDSGARHLAILHERLRHEREGSHVGDAREKIKIFVIVSTKQRAKPAALRKQLALQQNRRWIWKRLAPENRRNEVPAVLPLTALYLGRYLSCQKVPL